MIRKILKKKKNQHTSKSKIDSFLEKYNLPTSHLNVNRHMVSRGAAIGLLICFIPMPMQMLVVMALTPFIRFNVPIAISMVWLSNPFTMPAMYYLEYLTGNLILGIDNVVDVELSMSWFSENIDSILFPLFTGAAFYSIVVSTSMFFIINRLWIHSVKKELKNKNKSIN